MLQGKGSNVSESCSFCNKNPGLASRLSTAGSISQLDAVTIQTSSRSYGGGRQGRLGYRRNPLVMRPSAHLFAVDRVHLLGIGRTARGETANGCSSHRSSHRLLGYIWPLLHGFGSFVVPRGWCREEDLTNIKLTNLKTRAGYYL